METGGTADSLVHVYLLRDADPAFDGLEALWRETLSDTEHERADHFRFPRHARQSRLAHGLKRHALSAHHPHIAPADWRFVSGDHGKPRVDGVAEAPAFNLSHSEGVIALAVSPHAGVSLRLGIDVEATTRKVSEGLAERFFAPDEVAALMALPDAEQPLRFFALWTLKESYIKAVGMGLAIPLDRFAFGFSGTEALSFRADREERPEDWTFRQTVLSGPGGGHSLALGWAADDGGAPISVEIFEIVPDGHAVPKELLWQRSTRQAQP
ncbi:4'-phosphopantetheinyl transferase superfamily protein [Stappia sp. ES.058]|uniref:4'-phosphopantetheinyl transferase family protein n=1 Tax=Stappia sp. ES.058 TaxID=1881061 RepID=UPI00087AA7AC|nr:4'-phosphopantetheinyl transferase superfamily protein [Stappia sp. ES.058]SDU43442.1 4'-phosphopantetheinyl transferase [Stappia sp. ES.058]